MIFSTTKLDTTEKYGEECTIYAILNLMDAGYIDGTDGSTELSKDAYIKEITFEGHQFIYSVQVKGVWEELEEQSKELPFLSIKSLANMALEIANQKMTVG